ncbi:hypothetical protein [Pseudooceanicola antarcticus]|nr:hypothetical protein [Pseudooceanicola antarcticus]PJE30781.1 hypothetical protein CVM39_04870 [Pseudooceanicola antarcticus]
MAFFLALPAAQAHAASSCPVEPVSVTPVELTRMDSYIRNTQSWGPSGFVTTSLSERSGKRVTTTYLTQHPLLPGSLSRDGMRIDLSYDSPLEDIPRLKTIKRWRSGYTASMDGEVLERGTFELRYKHSTSIYVGACRYIVWVVQQQMSPEGRPGDIFEQHFSPELSTIIGTMKKSAEGKRLSGVFFDQIRVVE